MIKPKNKIEVCYNELVNRFSVGKGLSEIEFYRYIKISDKLLSVEDICVFAMAHTLYGKGEEALVFLEKYLLMDDIRIFKTYGVILIYLNKNVSLLNLVLNNAERFRDDLWFSWKVCCFYFIIGDVDNSRKKLKRHLHMINQPHRDRADRSMTKRIDQLSLAYDLGLTTPEHYKDSMYLALSVLDDFRIDLVYVDVVVFPDQSAGCFVEVKSDDPDLVAEMNFCLIEKQIEHGYSPQYDLEPQFTTGREVRGYTYGCE